MLTAAEYSSKLADVADAVRDYLAEVDLNLEPVPPMYILADDDEPFDVWFSSSAPVGLVLVDHTCITDNARPEDWTNPDYLEYICPYEGYSFLMEGAAVCRESNEE